MLAKRYLVKVAFHDADTDADTDILTDILARIVARMSVSVSASWNASFRRRQVRGMINCVSRDQTSTNHSRPISLYCMTIISK